MNGPGVGFRPSAIALSLARPCPSVWRPRPARPLAAGERHDLGVHNKVIWDGTPQLAKKSVVTEAKKTLHPGVRAGS